MELRTEQREAKKGKKKKSGTGRGILGEKKRRLLETGNAFGEISESERERREQRERGREEELKEPERERVRVARQDIGKVSGNGDGEETEGSLLPMADLCTWGGL